MPSRCGHSPWMTLQVVLSFLLLERSHLEEMGEQSAMVDTNNQYESARTMQHKNSLFLKHSCLLTYSVWITIRLRYKSVPGIQ
jgi:hypothetical protein